MDGASGDTERHALALRGPVARSSRRAPPGRRDWASGVVRGSSAPDFGWAGTGCFAAHCDVGARAAVEELRRRGRILDACDARGCWVTDQERALAESGRYRDYYALACRNGDLYACRAGEVASSGGEGWLETLAVFGANARVQGSLLWTLGPIKYAAMSGQVTEQIRVDLARAYVRYLDRITGGGVSPRFPERQPISDFHNEVFVRRGAGRVFGGDVVDRIPGFRYLYDWCPVCAP